MADPKVDVYMDAVVNAFQPGGSQVRDALHRIAKLLMKKQDPQPIQVLALRRYLRVGGTKLVANWPWTPAQKAANQKQTDALEAEAEIVQRNFAAANPGYTLGVSPIRDLDKQVRLWCTNTTVQKAAPPLFARVRTELAGSGYFTPPTDSAVAKFHEFLKGSNVLPEPTSAAPGTSDHGQMRAVDFVVMKAGQVIAGVESALIVPNWRQPGWERALIEAAKGTRLKGPLPTPYEPWHWWLPR